MLNYSQKIQFYPKRILNLSIIKNNYISNMNKFIIALMLLISSFGYSQKEQKIDGIVAVIGDEIITESDVTEMVNYAKADNQTITNKCDFVGTLMMNKMLLYKAKQDTIITARVTEDEVNRGVDGYVSYYKQGIGNDDAVLKYFKYKTMDALRSDLAKMVREKNLSDAKRYDIVKNVDVSPEDLKKFYQKHESEFPTVNEEMEYSQIILYPKLTEKHKQEYIDKLNKIKKDIQEGASFESKARLYSEDPGSAKNGGLIEGVKRGNMVKEFDAVAFSMEEGQISEPFETEYGFHIVYLEKKRGQVLDLRHILLRSVPDKEEIASAKEQLSKIRQDIKTDKITFKDAALKYSDDKYSKFNGGIVTNPKTNEERFEKLDLPTKILYNISGLKEGDVSDVFEDVDDKQKTVIRLLKINQIIPAHKMDLGTDYNKLKNFAKNEKQNDALKKWIEEQIPSTFITIQNDYKDCKFDVDWLQKNNQ